MSEELIELAEQVAAAPHHAGCATRRGGECDCYRLSRFEYKLADGVLALHAEVERLRRVERAARELDEFFDGKPGRWTLDRRVLSDGAADAMLSLHDYLNEVAYAALPDAASLAEDGQPTERGDR